MRQTKNYPLNDKNAGGFFLFCRGQVCFCKILLAHEVIIGQKLMEADIFISQNGIGACGIQLIIGADNGADRIKIQQEIASGGFRGTDVITHKGGQEIRGNGSFLSFVWPAGVIVGKDDIGGGEHGVFFLLRPVGRCGGGDIAGGDVGLEFIAQGGQMVAVPENDGGFFPLHHIVIDLAQSRIGIGYAFGVVMEHIQFPFGKGIGGNLDIPVGGFIFIEIQAMVFHGDDLEEKAGFPGLFQLIDDLFRNGLIGDIGAAVPVMLRVQVIFPQPGVDAKEGIRTVSFIKFPLIGMDTDGIIAQVFELAGIGEDILENILLIGHVAGGQHIGGHAGKNLELGANGAAAEGAGDHIAAGMLRCDAAVVFQRVFGKRYAVEDGRVPVGFGKDDDDIGRLEISARGLGGLIFGEGLFQIALVIIGGSAHVQGGKVQHEACDEAVFGIVFLLIAGGFGGDAKEGVIIIADGRVQGEEIHADQQKRGAKDPFFPGDGKRWLGQGQKQQIKYCFRQDTEGTLGELQRSQEGGEAIQIACHQKIPREEMGLQNLHLEIIDQGQDGEDEGGQEGCQGDALCQAGKGPEEQRNDDQTQEKGSSVFRQEKLQRLSRAEGEDIAGPGQVQGEEQHQQPQDGPGGLAALEKFFYFHLHFAKGVSHSINPFQWFLS